MANNYTLSVDLGVLDEIWDDSILKQIMDSLSRSFQGTWDSYMTQTRNFSALMEKSMQLVGKNLSKAFSSLQIQKAQEQVQKQSKNLTGSLRRTLMGFDQINRLNKQTGTGTSRIQKDMADMSLSLMDTATSLGDMWKNAFQAVPGGTVADRNPIVAALEKLGLVGKQTRDNTQELGTYGSYWEALGKQVQSWYTQTAYGDGILGRLITTLLQAGSQANDTGLLFGILSGNISSSLSQAWDALKNTWGGCGSWFETQVTAPAERSFAAFWSKLRQDVTGTYEHTRSLFSQVGNVLTENLSRAWNNVYGHLGENGTVTNKLENGVLKGLKSSINAILQGINTTVAEPFSALNTVLDKIQKVKVGKLTPFSFLSWRVNVPAIPQLAQGAVLPANKPFLAMVGDQRHGTNIEAPLSTIQEAVALTMEDMAEGNMAGHAATVEVLRDILQAVLGISISDSAIANACARHETNMAVVYGK